TAQLDKTAHDTFDVLGNDAPGPDAAAELRRLLTSRDWITGVAEATLRDRLEIVRRRRALTLLVPGSGTRARSTRPGPGGPATPRRRPATPPPWPIWRWRPPDRPARPPCPHTPPCGHATSCQTRQDIDAYKARHRSELI